MNSELLNVFYLEVVEGLKVVNLEVVEEQTPAKGVIFIKSCSFPISRPFSVLNYFPINNFFQLMGKILFVVGSN